MYNVQILSNDLCRKASNQSTELKALLNNMALEYWNTCTIQGNTDASISKVSVNKSRSHFF